MGRPSRKHTRRDFLRLAGVAAAGAACAGGRVAGVRAAPSAAAAAVETDPEVAAILRRIVPPAFPARVFGIVDHGAEPGGDLRPAVTRAIAACNAAGGGRVLVPPGTWRSDGPIHLKSGVELHLAEGATVRFSADPAHYLPMVLTRWEGTECYNYSPLIYAYQATRIAITGRGTIDGNGKANFAGWRQQQEKDINLLRQMGIDRVPVHERVFGPGHFLRPGTMQLMACRDVLVEGITLVDMPFWGVHPVACQNVTMRGVTVRSHNPNNDGVDPESSTDVLVERCTFDTGDDCIAIKSGRDQDGWRIGQPSENIVLRDCDMESLKAAICLGSEMSGGLRNIHVSDVRVGKTFTGIYFKTNLDRGGYIRHVRIRDVTMREAELFINFTTDYQGYRGGQHVPDVRDVVIERVTCGRAARGIRAVGVAAAPLREVTLRDVTIGTTPVPHEIRHVEGLRLDRVRINDAPVTLAAGTEAGTP
jgi:polygalacturonase